MKSLLQSLLPQSGRAVGLWFVLALVCFGAYYFWGPYSTFEAWYHQQQYWGDDDQPTQYEPDDTGSGVSITSVQVQKVIADFMESEVVVTVQNITETLETAIVSVSMATTDHSELPRMYIRTPLEETFQDTVTLKDIPPHAKVQATFLVRMAQGDPTKEYELHFVINGEKASLPIVYTMSYDPLTRFKMWIVSLLLLPPGSHITVPVVTMLFVSWIASLCAVLKSNLPNGKIEICKSWIVRAIGILLPRLLIMSLIIAAMCIALPEVKGRIHLIFFFVGGTLLSVPFYKWLAQDATYPIIVCKRDLSKGNKLLKEDICIIQSDEVNFLRAEIDCLVGKTLKRDIAAGTPLFKGDM